VSRSIGDVYLKSPEFNTSNSYSSSAAASSPISMAAFDKPILSAEPSLCEKELGPDDKFLIFASDGLWDMLSDQEVVDIVHKSPRKVKPHNHKPYIPSPCDLICPTY
jgi:pyruvate dehydrogenase phosphatase